jgi:hypothetical protein
MGDDLEPVMQDEGVTRPAPQHNRILVLMAALGLAGGVAGAIFVSAGFGIGVFFGTALSLVNYYWLKRSLKKIFAAAAEGERPRMLAAGYFLRYLVLGLIVAVIHFSGALPITAVVLGMASFGFAVVLEGFIRIFAGIFSEKEI